MVVEGPVGRSTCARFFLLPSDACCWALDTLDITFVRDGGTERVAILSMELAAGEAALASVALGNSEWARDRCRPPAVQQVGADRWEGGPGWKVTLRALESGPGFPEVPGEG